MSVFVKLAASASKCLRRMLLEAPLIDVDELIDCAAVRGAGGSGVGAPQRKAGHFLWQIELLAALGLDDPNRAIGRADDEIGGVGRKVSISLDVFELKPDSQVVLRKRRHVRSRFEERGKGKLKAA